FVCIHQPATITTFPYTTLFRSHIGAEMERTAVCVCLHPQLDREEGSIIDDDPAFLDRGDQKIFVRLALEHGSEQFHQRRPPDRGDRKSTRLNSSHVAISYAVFG